MTQAEQTNSSPHGIFAALATPLFLGMAPIFGKVALDAGADPFTVAALRTIVAVLALWLVYIIFFRRYIFIYPAGLMGCVVIGAINGVGSLFYYSGLESLDASLVQLINGSYLAFAVLISRLGGQKINTRTLMRVGMTLFALVLITGLSAERIDPIGVGFMLANALMFAATVVLSQYVLYEMPAPTAALYILTTMGVLVTMVWLAIGSPLPIEPSIVLAPLSAEAFATVASPTSSALLLALIILPIVALGITTALSRLAMFASVKFLGGMQTAVNAALEIAVALLLSFVLLGDVLTAGQWAGVAVLIASILLVRQKDFAPRGFNPNSLVVANMSSVQFHRIAFHRAFGGEETDNPEHTMGSITTQEMIAIRRMMGAEPGGVDPFPISRSIKISERAMVATLDELDKLAAETAASTTEDGQHKRDESSNRAVNNKTAKPASQQLQEVRIPDELLDN